MKTSDNIFLVGLMGAGKTTAGRRVAAELGKTFHDSDHEIESRTGVKVSLIFDIEGEAGFRAREKQVIDQLQELRRWHQAMLGREARIMELKQEVNDLLIQLRQPPRYLSVQEDVRNE